MNHQELKSLLSSLQQLLLQQGEDNWLRGIAAVCDLIDTPDGIIRARSMYQSMTTGVGSFADYNIWVSDFDARVRTNQALDSLRAQLWVAFDL